MVDATRSRSPGRPATTTPDVSMRMIRVRGNDLGHRLRPTRYPCGDFDVRRWADLRG